MPISEAGSVEPRVEFNSELHDTALMRDSECIHKSVTDADLLVNSNTLQRMDENR